MSSAVLTTKRPRGLARPSLAQLCEGGSGTQLRPGPGHAVLPVHALLVVSLARASACFVCFRALQAVLSNPWVLEVY